MAGECEARVEALYRYPVKGLSAQALEAVNLSAGQTMPFDRAWAVQDERGRFDASAPKYLPKINFLMLMRDERLAALEVRFDETSLELTIVHEGFEVARGNLSTARGRGVIEAFLASHMAGSVRGAPAIVSAEGHSFSDVSAKCLHIVNRASIGELEGLFGRNVDAVRFRPNVVVEGWPAWFELSLVGKEITIGEARLKVFRKTVRCPATNVDPKSGARNMSIPDALRERWGHTHFGVYAKVVEGGRVACGGTVGA